jgi:hypothetical protein
LGFGFDSSNSAGRPQGSAPQLVAGLVPVFPATARTANLSGTVTLKIAHDDHPKSVEIVGSELPMLGEAARATARTWQFNGHEDGILDATFRFEYSGSSCNGFDNSEVSARLPGEFVIRTSTRAICDLSPAQVVSAPILVSTVSGVVNCDCPDRTPVANASVILAGKEGTPSADIHRDGGTDERGLFHFEQIPSGTYWLQIVANGYLGRIHTLEVSRQHASAPMTLLIQKAPSLPALPIVVSSELPIYPAAARLSGLQGTVHLRVSPSRGPAVIDGDPTLAAEALRSVASWKFHPGQPLQEPLTVVYEYSLESGCHPGGLASVVMHFPDRVRIVGCSDRNPTMFVRMIR